MRIAITFTTTRERHWINKLDIWEYVKQPFYPGLGVLTVVHGIQMMTEAGSSSNHRNCFSFVMLSPRYPCLCGLQYQKEMPLWNQQISKNRPFEMQKLIKEKASWHRHSERAKKQQRSFLVIYFRLSRRVPKEIHAHEIRDMHEQGVSVKK